MKLSPLFCLLIFSFAPVAEAQQATVVWARAGAVKNVRGEVFYRCHLNAKEALPLEKGLTLHNGDTVLTAEQGSAAIALNPDSYLVVSADTFLRVIETDLGAMHFDVERGEVLVISRSLGNGVALVVHAPPAVLTVYKRGNYRIFVDENGDTEANVGSGELRYIDRRGNLVRVKKGKQVNFVKKEKMQVP
jgi:urease accessory protein UreE